MRATRPTVSSRPCVHRPPAPRVTPSLQVRRISSSPAVATRVSLPAGLAAQHPHVSPIRLINATPQLHLLARRYQHTQQHQDRSTTHEVIPKSLHQATKEERLRMSVSHDEEARRFSLRCDAAHPVVAIVDYDVISPHLWDLKYTQVSPEYQGHGVADECVNRVMEFAKANDIKVVCSCSYIADTFMKRHPEWESLLADKNEKNKAGAAGGAKQQQRELKYSERMKSEKIEQATTNTELGKKPDMIKKEEAKKQAEMDADVRAANEVNQAMTRHNERGFRGYG